MIVDAVLIAWIISIPGYVHEQLRTWCSFAKGMIDRIQSMNMSVAPSTKGNTAGALQSPVTVGGEPDRDLVALADFCI